MLHDVVNFVEYLIVHVNFRVHGSSLRYKSTRPAVNQRHNVLVQRIARGRAQRRTEFIQTGRTRETVGVVAKKIEDLSLSPG
jgi:hypothetical protein